jgi:hypothetical protein
MVKTHPFDHTMNDLFAKLEAALKQRQEAEIQIATNSAAIRALANTCEDEDAKASYLVALEELSGKPGFMAAIRTILRGHRGEALTPSVIQAGIKVLKLMDLSAYSNPSASIHTTLRRMVESGELEPTTNKNGEKAYCFSKGTQAMHDAMTRKAK